MREAGALPLDQRSLAGQGGRRAAAAEPALQGSGRGQGRVRVPAPQVDPHEGGPPARVVRPQGERFLNHRRGLLAPGPPTMLIVCINFVVTILQIVV